MTTPPRTQAERNADNALDVNRLRARNAELEAAVARVRALHVPRKFYRPGGADLLCEQCNYLHPCQTLAALATPEPVETLHGRNDETGGKS